MNARLLFLALSLAASQAGLSQESIPLGVPPAAASETAGPASAESPVDPKQALRQISEFEYELGSLRLNKKDRTLRFPGLINMTKGPLEYLIVNEAGSAHEALFTTTAKAFDLNVALLLLGYKPAEYFKKEGKNKFPHLVKSPTVLPEGQFDCWVEWKDKDGMTQTSRAERWVYNLKERASVSDGPFVYNGSFVTDDGVFVAQQSGNIVSLYLDAAALVNNPRKDQEMDDIWEPAKDLPEKGSPVTLIFQPAAKPITGKEAAADSERPPVEKKASVPASPKARAKKP